MTGIPFYLTPTVNVLEVAVALISLAGLTVAAVNLRAARHAEHLRQLSRVNGPLLLVAHLTVIQDALRLVMQAVLLLVALNNFRTTGSGVTEAAIIHHSLMTALALLLMTSSVVARRMRARLRRY
jgi:hypothetical protein